MSLILALILFLVLYGALEYRAHLRNLNAIPIRIHINGTRGKSSVARLIAAGLRAGGIRTFAKTTGSAARILLPDGSERPVIRAGPANIREQISIVRWAAREEVGALVLECMAISPDLQWVSEHKLLKSSVGVITNVRPDHLDVMGPTIDHVAASLANTVPVDGTLFVAERERLAPIARVADSLGTDLKVVLPDTFDNEIVQGFDYVEHKENVALAIAVCEHLGVPSDVALGAMRKVTPDTGALMIFRVCDRDKEMEFVSAFAANDRESTLAIWESLHVRSVPERSVIVIASMREDRPDRALQFGEIIAEDIEADYYILAGELTHAVRRVAAGRGLSGNRIVDLGGRGPDEIYRKVLELSGRRSLVVGVGNIGGMGGRILEQFRSRSVQG